jgi:16S rRNA (guanine1207-N2)-methyltransferase
MSDHYFTQNPSTEHNYQEFTYAIPKTNKVIKIRTDTGVFSKDKVDFGSDLLIESVEPSSGDKVLDIGCGYGIIGISLANKTHIELTMVDINTRAVELAKFNAELNEIKANVHQSDGLSLVNGQFNKIVFNPPIRAGKDVYYNIIINAKDYLFENGEIFIVIRKRQGGPSMIKHLESVYGNCEKVNKSGGYWILKSKKI